MAELRITKVKPMFNSILTTMEKYEDDVVTAGNILTDRMRCKGSIKEYQTVVEVGPCVRDIKPGDKVMINPKRYAVMKHQEGSLKDGVIQDNPVIQYRFDVVEIDGVPHLLLQDSDIMYVFEGREEEPSPIIGINKQLIV